MLMRQICFGKERLEESWQYYEYPAFPHYLFATTWVYVSMVSLLGWWCKSLLSSHCPSCPLEAGLCTIANTIQVLQLLCPNCPKVTHLTSSKIESFYCGWWHSWAWLLSPLCSHFALLLFLFISFRPLCFPCCFLNMAYTFPSQNLSTYISFSLDVLPLDIHILTSLPHFHLCSDSTL